MAQALSVSDIDDEAAEVEGLAQAVAIGRADHRFVPHDKMRAWLLRIAAGEFDAEPPQLHEA